MRCRCYHAKMITLFANRNVDFVKTFFSQIPFTVCPVRMKTFINVFHFNLYVTIDKERDVCSSRVTL